MVSDQIQRDADEIYARAFEWHGAIMLEDVEVMTTDWQPRGRAALAVAHLTESGLARFEQFRGKRLLRLVSPIDPVIALSST